MTSPHVFLNWIAAFCIVAALLCLGAFIQEWWLWRKEKKAMMGLAIIATGLACLLSFFVWLANLRIASSVDDDFMGGSVLVGMWLIVAALWFAWAFS